MDCLYCGKPMELVMVYKAQQKANSWAEESQDRIVYKCTRRDRIGKCSGFGQLVSVKANNEIKTDDGQESSAELGELRHRRRVVRAGRYDPVALGHKIGTPLRQKVDKDFTGVRVVSIRYL